MCIKMPKMDQNLQHCADPLQIKMACCLPERVASSLMDGPETFSAWMHAAKRKTVNSMPLTMLGCLAALDLSHADSRILRRV